MKKPVCLLLSVLIFLAGCAGREANPIPAYFPGDENRSCSSLKAEIAQLQVDMQRLLPKTDKGLTNALWAVGGVICIIPFFFMDLKDAEKIEFEAMRTRHNRLLIIAADRNCSMTGVRAERILSVEERKAAPEEANKQTRMEQKDSSPATDKTSVKRKLDFVVGAAECTQCGRHIGEDEGFCLFKLKRVCPECFKELTR